MTASKLELTEVTAEAMGWDDGHAWCPCGAEMVHRDDTGTLVCDTCGTDAIADGPER